MIAPGSGPLAPAIDLVQLDREHPGFRDREYRARRDAIARLALAWQRGVPPHVEYTPGEHAVWRRVCERLEPLHAEWASRRYAGAAARLDLDRSRIPQLADLNPLLESCTGFRMSPVAGLVSPETFLACLGRGEFLATQYVRHGSAPFYTPEPDVIHELIGHAATLSDPDLAALNRQLGQAAVRASDEAMLRAIERVYWFTLEFGVVREQGRPRALGAGLLSSAREIERLGGAAALLPWDLPRIAETPYDPTDYQPALFLAPSFRRLVEDVEVWLARP